MTHILETLAKYNITQHRLITEMGLRHKNGDDFSRLYRTFKGKYLLSLQEYNSLIKALDRLGIKDEIKYTAKIKLI